MKKNDNEQSEPIGFSSSDSIIIIEDRPGDNTIRPLDPRLKKIIEEGMQKLRRRQSDQSNARKDEAGE